MGGASEGAVAPVGGGRVYACTPSEGWAHALKNNVDVGAFGGDRAVPRVAAAVQRPVAGGGRRRRDREHPQARATPWMDRGGAVGRGSCSRALAAVMDGQASCCQALYTRPGGDGRRSDPRATDANLLLGLYGWSPARAVQRPRHAPSGGHRRPPVRRSGMVTNSEGCRPERVRTVDPGKGEQHGPL